MAAPTSIPSPKDQKGQTFFTPSNTNTPKPTPPPILALPSTTTTTTTTTSTFSPPQKKTPPLPWTHQETTHLIQSYQEKWYSLKKGQLKASQWEEVSITVAARCGYDEPSKSAIQCRHKLEKLRKRYRSEKQKPTHHPTSHSWHFFLLMDCLERGPLPISARPMAHINNYPKPCPTDDNEQSDHDNDDDEDGGGDGDYEVGLNYGHNVREKNGYFEKLDSGGKNRVLRNRKRKESFESDDDSEKVEEEEENGGGGKDMVVELAGQIRGFAERFVRMENKKIEMMRETERLRMEMETKRMQMIVESRMEIVDTIGRVLGSHK